jgi:hypothetical protein
MIYLFLLIHILKVSLKNMHYSIKTDYRDICLHFTGIPFPKDISSSRSKQVGYSGTHLESHHLGGEAGRSRVQGQAGLHSKTLFQKKKKNPKPIHQALYLILSKARYNMSLTQYPKCLEH